MFVINKLKVFNFMFYKQNSESVGKFIFICNYVLLFDDVRVFIVELIKVGVRYFVMFVF